MNRFESTNQTMVEHVEQVQAKHVYEDAMKMFGFAPQPAWMKEQSRKNRDSTDALAREIWRKKYGNGGTRDDEDAPVIDTFFR
jgi:hypothetical protein